MKISFIIPAYNEEFYIRECLESIRQALIDKSYAAEIIVVDNGSTDRTKEIASSMAGVTIIDKPVKSVVRARQTGFLASSGDLIANIDADSMLPPGWIDRAINEFTKNDKHVALSGPYIYYDIPKYFQYWVKFFYIIAFTTYLMNRFVLRVGSMLQGGNLVIRRSALKKLGGYNLDFNFYGDDTDIARRLYPIGDVKFSLSFNIYSSGRRIVKEGIFTMGIRYAANFIWATYFKKPFSKNYIDVRTQKENGEVLKYEPLNKRRERLIIAAAIACFVFIIYGLNILIFGATTVKQVPKQLALRMYNKIKNSDDSDSDFKTIKLEFNKIKNNILH